MKPEPIQFLRTTAGVIFGGFVVINAVSLAAIGAYRVTVEEKRKKSGLTCRVCRGKGFYLCKLCKGNATIKWSPLYDPVCINPCLCPTCDGTRVQRCLNCIGKEHCSREKIQQLPEYRIVIATVVGILIGCVCTVLFPNEFFNSVSWWTVNEQSSRSTSQVGLASRESTEQVSILKSELASIREENSELRKQVKELTDKLHLGEQQSEIKAMAFGTVKSLRTNPTVIPDESVNPRLAKLLAKVAVGKEIIVVLANSNVIPMLEMQIASVKRVGISNYLVVALDESIENFCKSKEVAYYKRDQGVDIVGKSRDSHAISALKFRVLREFLQLGHGVLLSDVDVIYLQNPFNHLYRDSDVESMSDGHDNATAYGHEPAFDDPSMGWSRFVTTVRIWVFNSGFFYLRPTIASIELLDRVTDTLSKVHAWDQAVFNEHLWYPSHPGYIGLHASKRVMDTYEFMNSRVLFKTVRKNEELKKLKPVIVHLNYHPDKLPRMQAVFDFYINGKQDALDGFTDGSNK